MLLAIARSLPDQTYSPDRQYRLRYLESSDFRENYLLLESIWGVILPKVAEKHTVLPTHPSLISIACQAIFYEAKKRRCVSLHDKKILRIGLAQKTLAPYVFVQPLIGDGRKISARITIIPLSPANPSPCRRTIPPSPRLRDSQCKTTPETHAAASDPRHPDPRSSRHAISI